MLPGIREKIINLVGSDSAAAPRAFCQSAARVSLRRATRPGARRLKLFHVYTERHMSQRPFDQ